MQYDVVMMFRYFPEFLSSVYYCKHQVDVLTGGNVSIIDILYNDTALGFFTEVH